MGQSSPPNDQLGVKGVTEVIALPKIGKDYFTKWLSDNNLFVSCNEENMKHSQSLIVSFALFFLFMASSGSSGNHSIQTGALAPNFTVSNGSHVASLQDARGKYVLITFWSSIDPQSRIINMQHDRIAHRNPHIKHLSINYDNSYQLFREICKVDKLDISTQFYGNNDNGIHLLATWQRHNGYDSFLVDRQGHIVAQNPSPKMLSQV